MPEEKNLRFFSYVFLAIAALNVIEIIVNFCLGSYANTLYSTDGSIIVSNLIAIIVSLLTSVLFKVYFAVRGLQQLRGTYNGTAHITLASIFLVINIIAILILTMSVMMGGSWIEWILTFASLVVLFFYRKAAKDLLG